ncbi:MAG TPA: PQQ-binding-like beta-propeller repeat protein [Bryobacteraceae bacterium]|nr:PQQ-binding-like beta-propeller repeat protein [Bryobacteraceae bacterium]
MSARATPARLDNPYPGLRPFDEKDFHLFFGRDEQIDELLSRLSRNRFLCVTGVSGSGKSSLVRAGLIPALRRGYVNRSGSRWQIATCRPGNDPLASLQEALAREADLIADLERSSRALIKAARMLPEDESLLVVIDQFEELFRYKDKIRADVTASKQELIDSGERASDFVRLLLTTSKDEEVSVYVVVTMRSDYLGDCAKFRDLPETLNDCQYLVPRMTREQRRAAIENPLPDSAIAPSLVQVLLNDAGDEPNNLPLLQHALMRTWHHWKERTRGDGEISLNDYIAVGGIEDALNRHAELLYRTLNQAAGSQQLAEWIFKRLTAKGISERETRSPAKLSELWSICGADSDSDKERVRQVVEHFRLTDGRFLTCVDDVLGPASIIDITHESLISRWKTLSSWVKQEKEFANTFARLLGDATRWDTRGGNLLTGLDLRDAEAWNERRNPHPAWTFEYLQSDDPEPLRLVERYIEASRAEEKKQAAFRRGIVAGLGALALVLGILAWVGFYFYGQARQETAEAERQNSRALEQEKAVRVQRDRAERLQREAVQQSLQAKRQASIAQAERDAADASKREAERQRRNAEEQAHRAQQARVSAEASKQEAETQRKKAQEEAMKEESQRQRAEEMATEADRQHKMADANGTLALARQLAADSEALQRDGYVDEPVLLGLESLKRAPLEGQQAVRDSLAHLPRVLWSDDHGYTVNAVAFSPDGGLLGAASDDKTVAIYDANTGKQTLKLEHNSDVESIAFSPDGNLIATGSDDKTARIFDAKTGKQVAEFPQDEAVEIISFSADGRVLITASTKALVAFSVARAKSVGRITMRGDVIDVAFSPGGRLAALASDDKIVRIFDLKKEKEVAHITFPSEATAVSFSPDGKLLAAGSMDGTAVIVEANNHRELSRIAYRGAIAQFAFSPDARLIATTSVDGAAHVTEVRTGREVTRFAFRQGVFGVAFSHDGQLVAAASMDGTVRVFQANSGIEVARFAALSVASREELAFSPKTYAVAVGTSDGYVRVFEAVSGRELNRFPEQMPYAVTVSPNHDLIAVGNLGGASIIEAHSGRAKLDLKSVITIIGPAISPDDRLFGFADAKGVLHVTSTTDSAELFKTDGQEEVTAFAFSPDGRSLATGGLQGAVHILDPRTGKEKARSQQFVPISSIAFAPDGRILACGNYGAIDLRDANTATEIRQIKTDSGSGVIAFSPDSKLVISSDYELNADVFETGTGKRLFRVSFQSQVQSIVFAPDGKSVLFATGDGLNHLIDLNTHQEFSRIHTDGIVRSAIFSSDGRSVDLVSMAGDGVRITRELIHTQDLESEACRRLTQNLTVANWKLYVGLTIPYKRTCTNLPFPDGYSAGDNGGTGSTSSGQSPSALR